MATGSQSLPHDTPPVDLRIRLLMFRKEIASICGRKGAVVKRFEKESGSRINISDREQNVTGSTDAIFKAFNLICKKLEKDISATKQSNGAPSPKITLRLIMSASDCVSLVADGGSKINEIRETTGASVVVPQESRPNSTERVVKVSGTSDAVPQCINRICCIMMANMAAIGLEGSTATGGGGSINPPVEALEALADSRLRSGVGLQINATKQSLKLSGLNGGKRGTKLLEIPSDLDFSPSNMGSRFASPHKITIIFKEEIADMKLTKIIRLSGVTISISFGVLTVTGMRSSIIKAVFHLCRVVEERTASPSAGAVLPITILLLIPNKMRDSLIGEASQEVDGLLEISGVSSMEMQNSEGTMKIIGLRNQVSRFVNYLYGEMFEFFPGGAIAYRHQA